MKKFWFLIILLGASAFACLSVCAQATVADHTIKNGKFRRWMKKENTVVLDVRTKEEFETGHIPGAINLDVNSDTFKTRIATLDKDKKYLLYCRSGKRSARALTEMSNTGFPDVYHLKGGIEAWKGPKE